jgi:2-amino-4-hydroxy-6-hydroxymethyldihydropteridine diphosphokinase
MPLVFLSLGSNKGDRLGALARAYAEISILAGNEVSFSSVYETEPWGFKAEQEFLNQVISFETDLKPEALISELLGIETRMGRKRQNEGYQSREIDIDILLYGDLTMEGDDLKLPHPRMHERSFVLIPLAELAPGIIHPVFGQSAIRLLNGCMDTTRVVKRFDRADVPSLFRDSLESGG